MPVVIEDVSLDGGNTFFVANPGRDYTEEAASSSAERARQLAAVSRMDRPRRRYHALHLTASYRPKHRALVLASYTNARSRGNYPGLSHPLYGTGESYLLPAGAFGRTPLSTRIDLHLALARDLGAASPLDVFIDVFNLLDAQDTLAVDASYTFDAANPVVGGDASDLRHVKRLDDAGYESNTTVVPNRNFGCPRVRQAPRTVQLGLRWSY